MNRLLQRANKRLSLGSAAVLLAGSSFIVQILGVLKTRLIYANYDTFGPKSTDIYFAAFKIPDFIYFTVAAGALGVAFMPFLSERLHKSDTKGAWNLSSSLMNLLMLAMGAFSIILLIFAKPLLHYIVAPDLTPEQLNNAALIMRLVSLNPLLFAISAVLTSVQQIYGRFFFYAIAPLLYNFSIIISVFVFKHNIGIVGLGVGALIGAVVQLLFVLIGLFGLNVRYRPKIMWRSEDFRQILKQLPPRSIDQGIDQINSIAETRFARRLGEGNISFYEGALTLHNAPTALIGTAISTAAFPRFTERISQGRLDLFRKEYMQVVRAMIWIALPVVVISFFARGHLARIIYADKAPTIALIFGYLGAAIFFRILYSIISRYFYAHKNTWTPLGVSLFAIALNIFLAYRLSHPQPDGYGVEGLAIAQSIVAVSEVVILTTIMFAKDPQLFSREFWASVSKIISITGFSAMAAFVAVSFLPLTSHDSSLSSIFKLSFIALLTVSVHLGISALFGLEEAALVIKKLRSFLFRPVKF